MTPLAAQPNADDLRWESEAFDAAHKSLQAIQEKADGWSKAIGAVLGAFALAAFIKGPEGIKDIPTANQSAPASRILGFFPLDPAHVIVVCIFVAAGLLVAAIYAAAVAAEGVVTWTDYIDGPSLQHLTRVACRRAINLVRLSRLLTLIAAVLVLGGAGLAWWSQFDQPPTAQSAIVSTAGLTLCGTLTTGSDGSIRVTPRGGTSISISGPTTVTLVAACPTNP
jgi:hypothetical protein